MYLYHPEPRGKWFLLPVGLGPSVKLIKATDVLPRKVQREPQVQSQWSPFHGPRLNSPHLSLRSPNSGAPEWIAKGGSLAFQSLLFRSVSAPYMLNTYLKNRYSLNRSICLSLLRLL